MIRFLKEKAVAPHGIDSTVFKKGDELECSDSLASYLVRANYAVSIKFKPPKAPEPEKVEPAEGDTVKVPPEDKGLKGAPENK